VVIGRLLVQVREKSGAESVEIEHRIDAQGCIEHRIDALTMLGVFTLC